ncbi:MAG: glycosyltransferase family 4 protein [Bacteroidetes bacterium]|nr:glycosyltransferase family 4 protein [Bacteroidota bacterium]MBS1974089.1 glycosyltransferase family 4 protein [Bacteroidota bacterium]
MKIGIEAQRIFRAKKHGMEVVALELIRQIQQLDNKNEYILFAKDDADKQCITEQPNFKIDTFSSYTYADWEQFRLPKAVRKNKPDFLHCTCNTAPIKPPVPLLLTLHDIIYLEKVDFKGTAYQNFGNLYRRFVVPRVAKKSKIIITVSDFERQTILEKLKLPEEKIRVVHNAVNKRFNSNFSGEEVNSFRKKHNLPENFLLFLGNTAPKKNTPNVIRAFAGYCEQIKDALPLVVLDYEKALVDQLLSQEGLSKYAKQFIFPGYISPTEMPLMYNAASVFLYPSLRESFGLPILEAMGCGAPVITSNTSSMPEIAAGAALLIDPYKAEEITQGIISMLSDNKLRENYKQKGKLRASEFTWESSARKLLSIYELMK